MITLDKISLLLYKALGYDWQRIHHYCYQQHGQFAVAIGNIKKQFHDHPHMQILMTLKQWTKSHNCSSQQLFDKIKPLLEHSPDYLSRLRTLLLSGHHHGMALLMACTIICIAHVIQILNTHTHVTNSNLFSRCLTSDYNTANRNTG